MPLHPPQKREIRPFYFEVPGMHWRQRSVQKSVVWVQSCFSGVLAVVVETESSVLSQLKTRWALIGEFAKLPENVMLHFHFIFNL